MPALEATLGPWWTQTTRWRTQPLSQAGGRHILGPSPEETQGREGGRLGVSPAAGPTWELRAWLWLPRLHDVEPGSGCSTGAVWALLRGSPCLFFLYLIF